MTRTRLLPVIICASLTSAGLLAAPALAADPASCATVRLSDPGWTDITATDGVASALLSGLGYSANIATLSVPIGYEALKNAETDVFLGNWMPAQQKFRDDLDASGKTQELVQNLTGAKFTLAVTDAGAALGIKDFADLDAQKDAFGGKIYGIEPGAPANQSIAAIIAADKFGLGDWELVESGEQAMLAQVTRNDAAGKPTVFLAWAPHPMNVKHKLTYLSGGDAEFGPDFGGEPGGQGLGRVGQDDPLLRTDRADPARRPQGLGLSRLFGPGCAYAALYPPGARSGLFGGRDRGAAGIVARQIPPEQRGQAHRQRPYRHP